MTRYLMLTGLIIAFVLALGGCGKKDASLPDDPTQAPAEEAVVEEVVQEEPVAEEPVVAEEETGPTEADYAAMAPQEYGIEDVFFAFDDYSLSDPAMDTLDAVARIMREHSDITYVIEGHCDERGTVEYNLALGEKRSIAVRDYLVSLGVPRYRLRVTSYGEEHPFARGSNEEAWAQNRRAHFSRP